MNQADLSELLRSAVRVLLLYGASLAEFRGPMFPGGAAMYAAHESRGRRWVRTRYPEAGLWALTLAPGDDECLRFDVDPLDPRAAAWGVQASWAWYGARLRLLEPRLPWAELRPLDQAWHLWCARSIGLGGLRVVVGQVLRDQRVQVRPAQFVERALAWVDSPAAASADWGHQTPAVVRLRMHDARELLDLAVRQQLAGGVPAQLEDLVERPAELAHRPEDLRERLAWYCRRAKSAGDLPTGPFPQGRP